MTDPTVAQPRSPDSLAQAIRERATRGLLLYNGARARIHRLEGDVWAVPASQGGFWRVDLAAESCPCPDFLYRCTDQDTGEVRMNCKHIVCAAIARAMLGPCLCYDGWHYMGHEVELPDGDVGVDYIRVACRRCQVAR
jgi:hypothetical protein